MKGNYYKKRTYIQSLGAIFVAFLSGCLSVFNSRQPLDFVLDCVTDTPEDVTPVPSDDERIAGIETIQTALAEARQKVAETSCEDFDQGRHGGGNELADGERWSEVEEAIDSLEDPYIEHRNEVFLAAFLYEGP